MDKKALRAELISFYIKGGNDVIESLKEAIAEAVDIAGDQKMSLIEFNQFLDEFRKAKDLDDAIEADK